MAKKKMTTQQEAIKALLAKHPEMRPQEIADALKTTYRSISTQLTRMRASGLLPKTKRGIRSKGITRGPYKKRAGAKAPRATVRKTGARVASKAPASPLPGMDLPRADATTLEAHLTGEHERVLDRLAEITATIGALTIEQEGLLIRDQRLQMAEGALNEDSTIEQAVASIAAHVPSGAEGGDS